MLTRIIPQVSQIQSFKRTESKYNRSQNNCGTQNASDRSVGISFGASDGSNERTIKAPEHYYINHKNPYSKEFDNPEWEERNIDETFKKLWNNENEYHLNSILDISMLAEMMAKKDFDLMGFEIADPIRMPYIKSFVIGNFQRCMQYVLSNPAWRNDILNMDFDGKKLIDYAQDDEMRNLLNSASRKINQEKTDARTLSAKIFMSNPIKQTRPNLSNAKHYFLNHKDPQNTEFDKDKWKYDDSLASNAEWISIRTMDDDFLPQATYDKEYLYTLKTDKNCDLLAPFADDDIPFILRLMKGKLYRSLKYLFDDPQRAKDLLELKIDGKSLIEHAQSDEVRNFLKYQEGILNGTIKPVPTPKNVELTKAPAGSRENTIKPVQIPQNVELTEAPAGSRVPEDVKHYYVNHDDPYSEDFEKTTYKTYKQSGKLNDTYYHFAYKESNQYSRLDRHVYAQIKALKDFDLLQNRKEYRTQVPCFDMIDTLWWIDKDMPLIFAMVESGHFPKTINHLLSDPKHYNDLINLEYDGKKLTDYADTNLMQELFKLKAAEMKNAGTQDKIEKLTKSTRQEYRTGTAAQKAETQAAETKQTEAKQNIDFFDAFEEVDDTNNETPQKEAAVVPKERKPLPDSYKNYTILNITEKDPKTVDEIIGMNRLKQDLKNNVIIPLNKKIANETLKANDIDIPNGILIESKQDTTSLIKALSNETAMPALVLLDPQELKPMLADIEKAYKETGMKTIVLIRDFDKFFTTGPNCDIDKKNFMLAAENCMDKGALLFATVDDKSAIDCKFTKLRIFDKVMELKNPDLNERRETLEQYFSTKPLFSSLNTPEIIQELAEKTEGFNYPAMEKILEEAARTAVAEGKNSVSADSIKTMLAEYTKSAGITPVNDLNKTAMYDTPEFKRIPYEEGEMTSLDELGGMPEIKERLRDLYVKPLKNLDKLQEQIGSAAIPDGAIFYGPAGNGKTLTAKVLARELGLPYYETKLSDIGTAFVHEEPKAIKKLATQLNDKYKATGERSVWFLDEFDSLGGERNGAEQHNKELTDALLQEFTNPAQRGFILIAATNDLSNVDSALKRRGRLGNWIAFSAPDFAARVDVIKKNLAKTPFTQELSTQDGLAQKIAKDLDGLSMSSIVSILNDAKRLALLNDKDFETTVKDAIDAHMEREMGEFCNKAGLKAHKYNDWDYKSLDELGGMEEVKQALEENIIDVWRPEIRQALIANKRSLPGGVILEGPPGGGKTTIVETLARQMGVPLYKMNYSQEGNEYIHGVARNVTDIFNKLALESKILKKPVILFFDEAEKFFPRYANGHQVEEVNTYKDLMNTASANGIILMAATNHIDEVNQEIIGNPRRMGTVIHVGTPNENDRESLIKKLFAGLPILAAPLTDDVTEELVKATDGMSIGQITSSVDKFITQAIKKKQTIEPENLIMAFQNKEKEE